MSDPHHDSTTSPQPILMIVLAVLVPILVILLLARMLSGSPPIGVDADAMKPEAIEARIQPVAGFQLAEAPDAATAAAPAAASTPVPAGAPAAAAAGASATAAASAPAAASGPAATSAPAAAAPSAAAPAPVASDEGKKIYNGTCMVCHATGVAGAPKFGDKAAWAPRIATGQDTLVTNSIKGIRAMPPRGGNGGLSDAQVRAAVEYMLAAAR